jgi:hypothetical protein
MLSCLANHHSPQPYFGLPFIALSIEEDVGMRVSPTRWDSTDKWTGATTPASCD